MSAKTISDIKENVELLHTMDRHARMKTEKKYKQKIFEYYKDVKEIEELLINLENCETGDYLFDRHGDFIYEIEVSKEIASLPEIESYLTQDYGFTYKEGSTLYIAQFMGEPITINRYTSSREYFVYNHSTGKPLIEKCPSVVLLHPTISLDCYVAAKILKYQNEIGEFSDVVEIDQYGSYIKHFDIMSALGDEVDTYENLEALEAIINNYERDL